MLKVLKTDGKILEYDEGVLGEYRTSSDESGNLVIKDKEANILAIFNRNHWSMVIPEQDDNDR